MAERGFFEELSKGFADAIADIREKVVEEPWFGRAVTERETESPQWPQAREEQSPAGLHIEIHQHGQEQERNTPEQDIDR
jgi:hypothetical protein